LKNGKYPAGTERAKAPALTGGFSDHLSQVHRQQYYYMGNGNNKLCYQKVEGAVYKYTENRIYFTDFSACHFGDSSGGECKAISCVL